MNPTDDEILTEVNRQLRDDSGWYEKAALLFVTLCASLFAGWLLHALESMLWLVLVIAIHEAGHYCAMRRFGYSNLRMFFIPLVGAAVLGYGGHVPAAKKAIVSLAGPLPGLFLGYLLGLLYVTTGIPLLQRLAEMLVVINGLNLLPIFPLDGGQFVRVLTADLDYRWRYGLLAAMSVLTAAGIVLLLPDADVIGLVVAVTLGGLLAIWNLLPSAKIAAKLASTGLAQTAMAGEEIQPEVAREIVFHIREDLRLGSLKPVADKVVEIWQLFDFTHPGAWERRQLGLVYAASLLSFPAARWVYLALMGQ